MANKAQKRKGIRGHIFSVLLTVVLFAVYDYAELPAYNIHSEETWFTVCAVLAVFGVLELIFNSGLRMVQTDDPSKMAFGSHAGGIAFKTEGPKRRLGKWCVLAAIGIGVIGILCSLASSTIFHAKSYASIAGAIEARDFIEDTPPSETISNIALMDSDSAQIIGARALGSLNELVSQFEINPQYTQINLNGRPMKVSPLEYADFFRWWNNRSSGIPGYIAVDPVNNTSEYIKLDQPMQYAVSARFGKNLYRHLRFRYRGAIFGNSYFEIAEDGTPYYITAVLKKRIFLFGGVDVQGAVILNACTGETQYYDVKDVPAWVDIVYDGDMLAQRYDWFGELSGGYFNSLFAKRDCKHVTDDYGYKMFDDDVWVFTGVTSVASDQSNIGFVLMNSRTAEIRYYAIPGAEEYSVMRSAEGEVQHLGYTASFPSVINVGGQPTYIMALKDKGGLVKQYALIHVERYNIVVTAETQREVMQKYKDALSRNGESWDDSGISIEEYSWYPLKVKDVKFLMEDGSSYAYIISEKEEVFKLLCADNQLVVLLSPGDKLEVAGLPAEESAKPRTVYSIADFRFAD